MVSIPGLDSINWGSLIGTVMKWVLYLLLMALAFGTLAVIFFVSRYKHKVIVRVMGQEQANGFRNVMDIKSDKMRIVSKHGLVQKWKLFKLKKSLPPLPLSCMYPKKYIFLDQLDHDTFIPTPFQEVSNLDLVCQNIKLWEQVEIKTGVENYTKKTGWDKYKDSVLMGITIIGCCVALGVTAYAIYKMMEMGRQDTAAIVDAINTRFNIGPG